MRTLVTAEMDMEHDSNVYHDFNAEITLLKRGNRIEGIFSDVSRNRGIHSGITINPDFSWEEVITFVMENLNELFKEN